MTELKDNELNPCPMCGGTMVVSDDALLPSMLRHSPEATEMPGNPEEMTHVRRLGGENFAMVLAVCDGCQFVAQFAGRTNTVTEALQTEDKDRNRKIAQKQVADAEAAVEQTKTAASEAQAKATEAEAKKTEAKARLDKIVKGK